MLSLDSAFKAGAASDYSVATIWGRAENGIYLLDVFRRRLEFPELKRAIVALAAKWSPHAVLVEDKASGQSLIQELQRDSALPVLAVKVDRDKETRAHAVTPTVEAGKVFLPEGAAWLADYLEEMSAFRAAPHDDQVDSTSQALNYLRDSQSFENWIAYARARVDELHGPGTAERMQAESDAIWAAREEREKEAGPS